MARAGGSGGVWVPGKPGSSTGGDDGTDVVVTANGKDHWVSVTPYSWWPFDLGQFERNTIRGVNDLDKKLGDLRLSDLLPSKATVCTIGKAAEVDGGLVAASGWVVALGGLGTGPGAPGFVTAGIILGGVGGISFIAGAATRSLAGCQ